MDDDMTPDQREQYEAIRDSLPSSAPDEILEGVKQAILSGQDVSVFSTKKKLDDDSLLDHTVGALPDVFNTEGMWKIFDDTFFQRHQFKEDMDPLDLAKFCFASGITSAMNAIDSLGRLVAATGNTKTAVQIASSLKGQLQESAEAVGLEYVEKVFDDTPDEDLNDMLKNQNRGGN
jgi:hypothetical protein